jgi:hypothetical protein
MHLLTLSWDNGFQKSSLKTAEIFEKFGLRAKFNIVAKANLPNNGLPHNMQPDACWGAPYGDFQQPTGRIRTLRDNLRLSVQRLNPGIGILVARSGARLPDEGRCDQSLAICSNGETNHRRLRRSRSLAGSLFEGVNSVARRLGTIAKRISHPDIGRLVALPDLKILTAQEILALAKQCTLFVLYD